MEVFGLLINSIDLLGHYYRLDRQMDNNHGQDKRSISIFANGGRNISEGGKNEPKNFFHEYEREIQ